ncbi:hypothetical protein F2Q70_00036435 [Brassica cretica]|uniref:Membralin n=1 Tax=Brassica cretica TaxID=69181 RepID=A0A8S9JX72_BRACR|nr:hypothetical protein F2Q70_00036435 [Brassica cretica]
MDPEQTFIRVQERFSQILNPRIRALLEYTFLFVAITLFSILVVMHANYVQQTFMLIVELKPINIDRRYFDLETSVISFSKPGCSSELTGVELSEAELLQIKITSAGLWSRTDESTAAHVPQVEASADNLEQVSKNDQESCATEENADDTFFKNDKEDPRTSFSVSAKETVRAAILRFPKKFYRRISFVLLHTARFLRGVRKIWIMIGILFFLFEFYDDQLLAFMVLVLVWLCELFTLISVRTPISMKFFPRFFLLYFLVFHIYFFSYAYGFSYLALMTTAAFMQHLILYFWNRFEVPALERFLQSRQSHLHQHPDFHITSSTILASTLHITRLNRTTRNRAPSGPNNPTPNQNTESRSPAAVADAGDENQMQNQPQEVNTANAIPVEPNPHAGAMSSFSSMLLRILGGASSEGFNSFLSMFRDVRDEDEAQVFADTSPPNPHHDTL